MLSLKDMSIQKKLILMQVFTSLLVVIVVFFIFIITDIRSFKKRTVDTSMSIAQVLGTNSISIIQFQDQKAAVEMLNQLHSVAPSIREAAILNDKDQVFAKYAGPGINMMRFASEMNDSDYVFTDSTLIVTYPIISANETIGKIFLATDLSGLHAMISNKYRLAILLLFLALGFSILVANVIQGYISKRLLLLVRAMKQVDKTGNYSTPLPEEGKDEIATLIIAFNGLMEQISENIKKKDEFIGIASHELKTPLTTIKGYIELLKMTEDQQPKKEFVESAFRNVLKLEVLVKDLLDVSRIESGQLQLEKGTFDLNVLLDETIAAAQMVASSHTIIRKDDTRKALIYGDRRRIEQVLANLLSNAAKYSPGEKEIWVTLENKENEIVISIRDFGLGIPKEEHKHIFDRFYRTKTSSLHISGFGLGLYICRDILARHGGKIWIESFDKGTCFSFSLPDSSRTQHPAQ